jgi:hypothetical protein
MARKKRTDTQTPFTPDYIRKAFLALFAQSGPVGRETIITTLQYWHECQLAREQGSQDAPPLLVQAAPKGTG